MPTCLLTVLIVGVPESVAAAMVCLALLNEKLPFQKITIAAAGSLLAGYILRLLPAAFGVHTILYAVVLGYLVWRLTSAPAQRVFTAAVVTVVLITASDILSVILFKSIVRTTFQELQNNAWLWSLSGLPHVLVLFLAAYALNRFPPGRLIRIWQGFNQ